MATTGIWNHAAASISLAHAHPMDGNAGVSGNSGSSTGGATISANDFLTLLVTEMQNQDPTATTDPNEYINQLVNVNSLEQLIQINQTLSTAAGDGSGSTGAIPVTAPPDAGSAAKGASARIREAAPIAVRAMTPSSCTSAGNGDRANTSPHPASAAPIESPSPVTAGNVGVPRSSGAAQRVAQAIGSRLRQH